MYLVTWNNCYAPCVNGYRSQYIYQQAYSTLVFNVSHFIGYANCLSNTCDWNTICCDNNYISNGTECWGTGGNSCGIGDSGQQTFCVYSDESLKEGIQTLKDALPKLLEIEAVEYDWNENLRGDLYEYFKRKGRLHTIGLIAQNVRKYYPEVVGMREDGYYFIEYHKLNAVLVEAIKSQQIFIDEIKNEIELLETKIN
jgi:hypothetical protein